LDVFSLLALFMYLPRNWKEKKKSSCSRSRALFSSSLFPSERPRPLRPDYAISHPPSLRSPLRPNTLPPEPSYRQPLNRPLPSRAKQSPATPPPLSLDHHNVSPSTLPSKPTMGCSPSSEDSAAKARKCSFPYCRTSQAQDSKKASRGPVPGTP
jgi:hypothetical protein